MSYVRRTGEWRSDQCALQWSVWTSVRICHRTRHITPRCILHIHGFYYTSRNGKGYVSNVDTTFGDNRIFLPNPPRLSSVESVRARQMSTD